MKAVKSSAYLLWIAIPILSMLTQISTKMLAAQLKAIDFGWEWLLQAIHIPWVLGILACEAIGFTLWLGILAHTTISKAIPITALSYVLVLLVSWMAFKEPILPLQVVGSILIIGGVWLIGTASINSKPVENVL
jgi:drug/metabolite transporter (DMT)-like permease